MDVVRELLSGGAGGGSAALCKAAEHPHLEVAHHPSTCNALDNTHLDVRPSRASRLGPSQWALLQMLSVYSQFALR